MRHGDIIFSLQSIHQFLKRHSVSSPEQAKLYFIPVYTEQLYHSLKLNQDLSHQDSLAKTSALVLEAIHWVKQTFPFWNRTNGLNHFMAFTLDHGRCHSLAGLGASDFGDLFSIQLSGDILMRDFETGLWHCYRPGRDILIPTKTEDDFTIEDAVSPQRHRSISVLYRFTPGGHGAYGSLRTQLLEAQRENPIPYAREGWASIEQTYDDMRRALFCVCPPGIAQHTLRVFRSIISGCIPVTFFKGNDMPFQSFLGVEYPRFSVNINPDEAHLLPIILKGLLAEHQVIVRMQRSLQKVQKLVIFDYENGQGVYAAVLQELYMHPARLL